MVWVSDSFSFHYSPDDDLAPNLSVSRPAAPQQTGAYDEFGLPRIDPRVPKMKAWAATHFPMGIPHDG
jgi:hypothetical protein